MTRAIKDIHEYTTIIGQKDYISHSITWIGADYKTNIIWGGRLHPTHIFRAPDHKLAAHTRLTYTARYCDCNGCVYALRKDRKQPKLRHTCTHIDTAVAHILSELAQETLTTGDQAWLRSFENRLKARHTRYEQAESAVENWPHKSSFRTDLHKERVAYHNLQMDCMRTLQKTPHLYAHATQAAYPHIHKIK